MVAARVRVATHDAETVAAIHDALDVRQPLALLHAKLAPAELARQRAAIEAASFTTHDAFVLFTSGSTGIARGVVLSRAAVDAAAAATWEHIGRRADDAWSCMLPLAHAGGLSIIVRCRAAGIPHVLEDPDRARARATSTSTIRDESAEPNVSMSSVVPTMLDDLEASPALRAVFVGGAAAAPELIDAAIARGIPAMATYGLTETFGMVATARVPGGPLVPLPGVQLSAGTRESPALVRIRAPQLATRYLDGEPIAPELETSDLGFLDGGALHIVGRSDDIIITGGENVHPAQVERILVATPGVRAALVFSVADPRWGQLVAAAIEPAASGFDREHAAAYWHAALPAFQRPRRLALVDALPRLPSGKPDRRAVAGLPTVPVDYD